MIKPQPKYGWQGDTSDAGLSPNEQHDLPWHVRHHIAHLEHQIEGLNEIIETLAKAVPDVHLNVILDDIVQAQEHKQPTERERVATLVERLRTATVIEPLQLVADTDGIHRVPKTLKGRPELVPDAHFAFDL